MLPIQIGKLLQTMQKQQQPKRNKKGPANKQWNQKSVAMTLKKVHSQNIISISPLDENLFYTASQDNTIRLWDIRVQSSVKLITSQVFKSNKKHCISNCQNNLQNLVFVGFNKNVYSFDVRKENIFTNEVYKKSEEQHFDDISFLKFNQKLNILAVADDQGDIRIYNPNSLQQSGLLDQTHTNICNSLDFMFPEKSASPLCISGGFDCQLIQWNMLDHTPIKTMDMNEIFVKYQIQAMNTMPFIHHIECFQNSIIVSLQSGHILCTTWNQFRKPKFIMEANLTKIVQTRIFQRKNLTMMISLNGDKSWTMFDFIKRDGGCPHFIQKYSTPFEPTWIQTLDSNIVLVAGYDPALAIYRIKA